MWQIEILKELNFESTRSGGAGGQHVNRTESAVLLRWSLWKSKAFDEDQKKLLFEKLKSKWTESHELLIRSESQRSQLSNKEECIAKLIAILTQALFIQKKRKKTKPTRSSKEKRLQSKKRNSSVKQTRSKVWP
mgnify:CR=1 FL=1